MMKTVRDGDRKFRRMKEEERIYEFNCGNNYEDLNDFIINDAPLYRDELLAVTYVIEDSENGLRAGIAAGMKTIGIPDVAEFGDEIKTQITAEFSSLCEALDYFKTII